jgi:hypothetical protein
VSPVHPAQKEGNLLIIKLVAEIVLTNRLSLSDDSLPKLFTFYRSYVVMEPLLPEARL